MVSDAGSFAWTTAVSCAGPRAVYRSTFEQLCGNHERRRRLITLFPAGNPR